ncbi:MAG: NADH-quinone oxidoreductase subunit M [Bacteroidetes bacterium]|nr:NADH-quinone oxidoreductase subunit M [Bacteroidota bacterium]
MTLLLILIPFIVALSMLAIKGQMTKIIALTSTLLSLATTFVLIFSYNAATPGELDFNQPWMPSLGINFALSVDGISLLMVLLTNFLLPLIVLASFNHEYKNSSLFYGMVLMMQAALNGVFLAADGMLFYVFWELALIPIWFICAIWGGENRIAITLKFFIYTFSGSLLMLVALIYMYLQTPGTHSFAIADLYNVSLNSDSATWVFWFMFIGFAIKMPVFPFHTWQPDTYTEAPAPGTMLLSGIMLKMGIYGMMRWLLPMAPEALSADLNIPLILSVIGVVYAAIIAIRQTDLKRIVAYSSISHVGLIAAGILASNKQGLQGGVIQMLAHGINVVGLFYIIDIIEKRTKTRDLHSLGGIAKVSPKLAVLFMIILLGAVAVPLTNGFVGEFLLLNGIYSYGAFTAAIAGLTIIFCAVYMLRIYQFTMFGKTQAITENFEDLNSREFTVLTIIAAAVIVMGIYPQPILDLASPAVDQIIDQISGKSIGLK